MSVPAAAGPAEAATTHLALLREIVARAALVDDVADVWILGSARNPESLDRWSDVDVGMVVTGQVPLASLLPPESVVWALDRSSDDVRSSCRVVLADGRRIDFVVASAGEFERAGGRRASACGPGHAATTGALVVPDPPDAAVNEVRFVAVLAAVKYGRGDQLIGSHLTFELARLCLVQAMLLRDRDERTTSHRYGTARDEHAGSIWSILQSDDATPQTRIRALAESFDRLHSELDSRYLADWSGLRRLIA